MKGKGGFLRIRAGTLWLTTRMILSQGSWPERRWRRSQTPGKRSGKDGYDGDGADAHEFVLSCDNTKMARYSLIILFRHTLLPTANLRVTLSPALSSFCHAATGISLPFTVSLVFNPTTPIIVKGVVSFPTSITIFLPLGSTEITLPVSVSIPVFVTNNTADNRQRTIKNMVRVTEAFTEKNTPGYPIRF